MSALRCGITPQKSASPPNNDVVFLRLLIQDASDPAIKKEVHEMIELAIDLPV